MTQYINPFTARSGVDPRFVVGRDAEISFFNDRLSRALRGQCEHYVITGSWGVGKTVLLRQMKLSAQSNGAWAAMFYVRAFSAQEGLKEFTRHVLDMVAAQLPVQPKHRSKDSHLQGFGIGALSFNFQVQWNKGISDKDPQLILRDGLLEIYKHANKNNAQALILLIDDIHNLPSSNEQLTLLRNVLTDEQLIKETKILTVVASIEEGWAPYLIRNNPVGRLFMPRRPLGRLKKDETRLLIDETLSGNMVHFDEDVKEQVFRVTQGHVFEVQALCEALFDQQLGGRVSMANWETALNQTLLVLADAQFSGMKQRASEIELSAIIVIAAKKGTATLAFFKKEHPEIRSPAEVLRRLTEKGLVNRKTRGQYTIDDELFCEYLRQMRDD